MPEADTLHAGIGNVYKSEVLFITELSPFAGVADLDPEWRLPGVDRARWLLRRNLEAHRALPPGALPCA